MKAVIVILISLFLITGCKEKEFITDQDKLVYITSFGEDLARDWQVNYLSGDKFSRPEIYFDTESREGDVKEYSFRATGQSERVPATNYYAHHVRFKDLEPNTLYYFIVGDIKSGYTPELKFRTPPADGTYRYANGGDMSASNNMRLMTGLAASHSPDFILIGGDIAYGNGISKYFSRWLRWLGHWSEKAVNADGEIIPVVLGIGNHETNKESEAPYYHSLFAQTDDDTSYFVRTLGDTTFLFLDSGNVASHKSQVSWMKRRARKARNSKWKIAVYHHGLYPSHRSYGNGMAKLGRKYWLSMFDEMKLTMALEHHDHTYKRTYYLEDGKVVAERKGTLYLGDGNWGVGVRTAHPDRWYLRYAKSEIHFWLVDVDPNEIKAQAINIDGKTLDQVSVNPR